MAWKDTAANIDSEPSISPSGARSADVNGSEVDLSDAIGAAVVINIGTYTDGSHEFIIQERDGTGSWSAVADGDLNGTEPTIDDSTDDDSTITIGYLGTLNKLRATTSTSNTTTGAEYSAAVVKELRNSSAD